MSVHTDSATAGPAAMHNGPPIRSGRDLARKLVGFGSLPLLSAVAPLAILPVIARTGGPDAWIAIATGQSVGVVAATVLGFGWSVTGPPQVARASIPVRRQLLRDEVRSRVVLAGPVLLLAVLAASLLATPSGRLLSVSMACATAPAGLSGAWFCVGAGTPGLIARYEALPRVLGIAASALLIWGTGVLVVYPALLLLTTVCGSVLLHRRLGLGLRMATDAPESRQPLSTVMRGQARGAAIEVSGSAYTAAPVLIAGQVLTTGVVGYVSGDRLYRLALYVVVVVGNALQSWLPAAGHASEGPRRRVAFSAHAMVGLLGGLAFAILAPWASQVLFGADLRVPQDVATALGAAFVSVSMSTTLIRHWLLPRGGAGLVLGVTVVGGAVGIVMISVLGASWGAGGVALGVAGGELLVVVALLSCHHAGRLLSAAPRRRPLAGRHTRVPEGRSI